MKDQLKFSIIIPVRSINAFLKENITHLKHLKYENFEVIILLDEMEAFDFSDVRFKLFAVGKKGPGEKRNIGATKATGHVLAFLDDDAYPTPDWLSQAEKLFDNPSVYALGAPAMTPPDAEFLEQCSGRVLESWLTSGGTIYRHKPLPARLVNDYPTVNLFIRKQAFDAVGGFSMEFWPGEDTKICLDLVKYYGRNFLYDPRPIVYHHRRNLFMPHLKQISRYGMHRGQFARIFPENSRNPSYFVPTAFLLGLICGPIVCVVIPQLWWFYLSVIVLYKMLLLSEGIKEKSFRKAMYVMYGIFLTHVFYGYNFLLGLFKRPKLKLREVDAKTGNYIGG
jgi:glycosyltransferase involved in cell wall biosynthesis